MADRETGTGGGAPRSTTVPGSGASVGPFGWLARAAVAGAGISLVVHVVVMLLTSVLFVEFTPPGDSDGADGPIAVATITEVELAEIIESAEQAALDVPESRLESQADIAITDDLALEEIAPLETDADVTETLGGGDVSADDTAAAGGGGGGSASFFGIEATGDRFAYIVDVSTSMRDANKIGQTRKELSRSIGQLLETSKFMVVTYSTDAKALGGRERWVDATKRNVDWANREIGRLVVSGSTNPAPAFEIVFDQNALPDAIYFMTDGEFAHDVVQRIAELNSRAKRPVHCILFGEFRQRAQKRRIEARLTQIADDSGGTFRHVEGLP